MWYINLLLTLTLTLASTTSSELDDFAGAKFHCPHALADGN